MFTPLRHSLAVGVNKYRWQIVQLSFTDYSILPSNTCVNTLRVKNLQIMHTFLSANSVAQKNRSRPKATPFYGLS